MPLVSPETFEPILRQRSVPRGVLDISVSKVGLQCAGIVAIVRELGATGMPKHVRMSFDRQLRGNCWPLDHPGEARSESGAPRSETNANGDFVLSR
jgi:hypothetical protein